MNGDPSGEEGAQHWFLWFAVCAVFVLALAVVLVRRKEISRRVATVQIDSRGTARVGGVLPVNAASLGFAKLANGGKLVVVADKGTSISNVVRVLDGLSKASTNSGQQPSPMPR